MTEIIKSFDVYFDLAHIQFANVEGVEFML